MAPVLSECFQLPKEIKLMYVALVPYFCMQNKQEHNLKNMYRTRKLPIGLFTFQEWSARR